MPLTFGDQLKLFALSVDVVDEARFSRVKRLIHEYCRETLGIEVTKLHEFSNDVDGQPGLKRYGMGALEEESSSTLRNGDGSYKSQSTLAYDRCKPLWIVSASGKQKLGNGAQCRDLWSCLRSVPPYRAGSSGASGGIKTSIIVPISNGDQVLGVLNFETSDYIEITDAAKTELTKIAETLGILIPLFRAANAQKSSTETALENIRQLLSRPLPKLTKPKIFLASSVDAEADVIGVVLEVLKEGGNPERLDLVYWKAMDQPGNINRQLLEAVASCRYGICYFSQMVGDGEYVDNVNVVFEAGMFHGRVDEITPMPTSWIPIRERQSPDLPFDFAQERILWVERNNKGELKTKPFASALRGRLDALLSLP